MTIERIQLAVAAFALTFAVAGSTANGATIGPDRGALVIHGGGGNREESSVHIKTFLNLVGDLNAPIAIVPTAAGLADYGEAFQLRIFKPFRDAGATNVRLLHARSREEADSDEFSASIRASRGIWFLGGRQWRLADTYLGTKSEKAFHEVLDNGGVIGGGSAGASIMGSFLVRGDTRGPEIVIGDHQQGFGFLRNVAIDQHLLERNRQFGLLEVVKAHPELLGLGLDENTAVVVKGDQLEVIHGYVAVYDPKSIIDGRFYFVAQGDRFDLASRTAFDVTTGAVYWLPGLWRPFDIPTTKLGRYSGKFRAADDKVLEVSASGGKLWVKWDDAPIHEVRAVSATLFYDVADGSRYTFEFDVTDKAGTVTWKNGSRVTVARRVPSS